MTTALLLLGTLGLLGVSTVLLRRGGRVAGLTFAGALVLSLAVGLLRPPPRSVLDGEPKLHRTRGYLGSGACSECHPGPAHSFAQTYHRTMTRRVADLDEPTAIRLAARLETRGRTFEVARSRFDPKGLQVVGPSLHIIADALHRLPHGSNEAFADERDIDRIFGAAPVERHDIVLVTGSHHYLAFWIEGGPKEELRQLPFVWLLVEKIWVPREEAFLAPPDSLPDIARWNGSCIQCHAVAGMPGEQDGKYQTQAAELGIACEACHGPGGEHANAMRSPLRRYLARSGVDNTSSKLNPAKQPSDEASAICGQCHAYFAPTHPGEWWETGYLGEAPSKKPAPPELPGRSLIDPERPELAEAIGLTRSLSSIYWPDGSVIVGGREYNGLIRSACYSEPERDQKLGCLDCHSMHSADPNDQLKPNWQARCVECHADHNNSPSSHSRHPTRVGCPSCHMPKTSYALLGAIASHRILVPAAASSRPPSACALCHTNMSKGDLERGYARLWGKADADGGERKDPADLPLALELALSGDALQRALLARAFVSPGALELTGVRYPRAVLESLRDDPYPAMRRIAQRSLDELSRFAGPTLHDVPPPSSAILTELAARRDNSPVTISE